MSRTIVHTMAPPKPTRLLGTHWILGDDIGDDETNVVYVAAAYHNEMTPTLQCDTTRLCLINVATGIKWSCEPFKGAATTGTYLNFEQLPPGSMITIEVDNT